MKNVCRLAIIWAIMLSTVLTACATGGDNGSSDPGAEKTCQEGVCAEITVAQPIVLNQPTDVTVKISSTVDMPGLLINLQASPTNVIFGSDSNWYYDAVANQSQEFHSTITFSSTGGWLVAAVVYSPKGGPIASNQDRVVIDSNGAIVNPTINPNPTSDLFIINTPLAPQQLTATADALPTPPPLPQVEGFTPQEWLQKCGWTVDKPDTISLWPDVSAGLNVKETVIISEQVTGTLFVGFKDITKPDATIQVKIGLCTQGKGWTTDTVHEWNLELHSGKSFETPVSMQFTDLGEIPIFVVALDTQKNRIAGIGRLIYVKPNGQSSNPHATPSDTKALGSDNLIKTMATSPQWHLVASEPFYSSSWPLGSPLWAVNDTTTESPTDLDRKWGVRQADYAAWPAAGGAAGLLYGTYPNSYSSEMILGPVNTNGAAQAEVDFRMLLDTELNYDFLKLYVSNNGYGWTQKGQWSGSNSNWSSYTVDLSGFVGPLYPNLYLKWVFTSDINNLPPSYTYTGVWVDDINLWILPGTVTISGTVTYTDRYVVSGRPAAYINVQVWNQQTNGSWLFLEEKPADANGYFQFDPRENWMDDPGETDHRLDIYLQYETVFHKGQSNEHKVTRLDNTSYIWPIDGYTHRNVANGTFNGSKVLPPDPESRAKAIWLFEDIVHAYFTVPGDPGPARVRWEQGTLCTTILGNQACSAFFVPTISPDGVFIPDKSELVGSQDVVVHEVAHEYMANSNSFWYPLPGGWNTYQACVVNQHHFFDVTTSICAYTEGWADFVAVAVNRSFNLSDNCFDWSSDHCGAGSQNIENPHMGDGQPIGDTVEGRIAGSLWDFYDSSNEGYDHSTVDLMSIFAIQRATGGFTFQNFWNTWSAQSQTNAVYNKHYAVQSIYQNSIDYDNSPWSSPIGDVSVLQGLTRDNAVDLWGGPFGDQESAPSEMTYSIVNTNANCGARIDANHYVDIDLRSYPTNLGICTITVRASDGIKTVDTVFRENILRIIGKSYLPITMSDGSGGTTAAVSQPPSSVDTTTPMINPYPAPLETIDAGVNGPTTPGSDTNPYPAPNP